MTFWYFELAIEEIGDPRQWYETGSQRVNGEKKTELDENTA